MTSPDHQTDPRTDPRTGRRTALRDRLTDIAEARIATGGLAALRARDLAAEAGCALGAIYNVFDDLTAIVLAANARTFARLGAQVAAALATAPADPLEQLVTMAQAYHRFASTNRHAWRALFDLPRPADPPAPLWYLAEMDSLFSYIADPLTAIHPQMPAPDRALLTRALFSAVHGIVLLGLEDASAGVPAAEIDRMIALVLRLMVPAPVGGTAA